MSQGNAATHSTWLLHSFQNDAAVKEVRAGVLVSSSNTGSGHDTCLDDTYQEVTSNCDVCIVELVTSKELEVLQSMS